MGVVAKKKKKRRKKRNIYSILLHKMEDGERGNFVTIPVEGKFRKGELS
jgi:hypothetical protein